MGNGKCDRQSCLYLSTSHVRTYKKKELSLALREKKNRRQQKQKKETDSNIRNHHWHPVSSLR